MTQTERKRSINVGRLLNILFALTTLFGLPGVMLAQVDQARITGVVRDQNNAVVSGATITVRNERTGDIRTTTSNQEGGFTVSNLKPSLYTIQVTAANFGKAEYTSVELVVGQAFDLAAELKPAGSSESVTIG